VESLAEGTDRRLVPAGILFINFSVRCCKVKLVVDLNPGPSARKQAFNTGRRIEVVAVMRTRSYNQNEAMYNTIRNWERH